MANHGSATQREETPHETSSTNEDNSAEKLKALAEIICAAGDEPAAALLVLMSTLENADDPQPLVNTVKHLAYTRCGELNVYGIVDAQIVLLADKLLAITSPTS